MNAFGPDWEDGVPRVVTHCPDRVHKLKALGNALVPQVAWQVFQAIDEQALGDINAHLAKKQRTGEAA